MMPSAEHSEVVEDIGSALTNWNDVITFTANVYALSSVSHELLATMSVSFCNKMSNCFPLR